MAKTGVNSQTKSGKNPKCCEVESVIIIDERGQMVLPKSVRDKAGIKAGDKLAVVNMKKDEEIYCIALIKIKEISKMVEGILSPLMKEVGEQ